MSEWLEIVAAVLASLAALVASNLLREAVTVVEDALRAWRVKSVEFKTAVASEDIFSSLAADFATIGGLSLDKYSSSRKTRARVDAFLADAKAFLTADPSMDAMAPAAPAVEAPRARERATLLPSAEDSWNLLARLRRDIEVQLRKCAEAAGLESSTREPISRTLSRLQRAGVLDERSTSDIAYFYRIASAAIHGEDVPPDLADEALWVGQRGLKALCRGHA